MRAFVFLLALAFVSAALGPSAAAQERPIAAWYQINSQSGTKVVNARVIERFRDRSGTSRLYIDGVPVESMGEVRVGILSTGRDRPRPAPEGDGPLPDGGAWGSTPGVGGGNTVASSVVAVSGDGRTVTTKTTISEIGKDGKATTKTTTTTTTTTDDSGNTTTTTTTTNGDGSGSDSGNDSGGESGSTGEGSGGS